MNSVKNADAVGNVNDIIAAVKLLNSVNLLAFFIFFAPRNGLCAHIFVAGYNGEFSRNAFESRRKCAEGYRNGVVAKKGRVWKIGGVNSAVFKLVGKVLRRFCVTAEYGDRKSRLKHR